MIFGTKFTPFIIIQGQHISFALMIMENNPFYLIKIDQFHGLYQILQIYCCIIEYNPFQEEKSCFQERSFDIETCFKDQCIFLPQIQDTKNYSIILALLTKILHLTLLNNVPRRKSYETRNDYILMKSCNFFTSDPSSHWPKNSTFYNTRLVCKPFIKKINARLILIQLMHIYKSN